MDKLSLGSLFDGSGTFPLGAMLSGISPVWVSEIDPFPIRVTTKRLPFLKHYGDVSKIRGDSIEPVDIITFGSPCQDMSVAGRRSGLDGNRSSLFYQAVRIIKEMRCATDGKYPRYAVWENVPGAFSSNGGADFAMVLQSLLAVKAGGVSIPQPDRWADAGCVVGNDCSVAWRTLDAQYWGVPQRRKRIYLVADFAGQSAGQILFESEGLSGYSAESFRAWQKAAGNPAICVGESGENGILAFHINQREEIIGNPISNQGGTIIVCLNDHSGSLRMDVTEGLVPTLRAESNHPPCVVIPPGHRSFCLDDQGGQQMSVSENVCPTLRAEAHGNVPCVVDDVVPFAQNQRNEVRVLGDKAGALAAQAGMKQQTYIADFRQPLPSRVFDNHIQDARYDEVGDVAPTVVARYGTGGCNTPFVVEGLSYGIGREGKPSIVEELQPSLVSMGPGYVMQPVFSIQGNVVGRKDENGPQGSGVNEGVSFTLNATDIHAVGGVSNTPVYTTSHADFSARWVEDVSSALTATDSKDAPCVYAPVSFPYVRRMTPAECARLQGFPDWWCSGLETEDPTEDELDFWERVFTEYRDAVSPGKKIRSRKQIAKWLKSPHSDSAEYKMWGNGCALPNVYFVLSGIAWANEVDDS